MFNWLKKNIFLYFSTGTISMILAACYGPITDQFSWKNIRAKNSSGKAIEGLQLIIKNSTNPVDTLFTDSSGFAEINVINSSRRSYPYYVQINDIDGDKNLGIFQSQEIQLNDQTDYEITMQPQTK